MRVQVFTKSDQAANASLFKSMHRQRHDVFAVELGWSALRSRDGLEIDQFDDDHARYLSPAFAQTTSGSGGNVGAFIQNVIDLLNNNVVRGLAVIAVILTGISWMFSIVDLRRAGTVIIGIIVIFSASTIVGLGWPTTARSRSRPRAEFAPRGPPPPARPGS